jgi:uncharacterized protein YjbJ (UPF0337 family)
MSERMDELKGNLKQGVGRMTGDTDLEAEGKAEHDTAKASREIKGAGNQIKGHLEEGVGKLTGDEQTRAKGLADRLKGDSQRAG